MEIFSTAKDIYKKDGQSLDSWLNESLRNSNHGREFEVKEVSISTYKEQFKNMLSLDIWIDRLLQWQANDYKLEMPVRESVDPLQWNKVLKNKLLMLSHEEEKEMNIPVPKVEILPRGDIPPIDAYQETESQRKRMYSSNFSAAADSSRETDKYRMTKMQKVQETPSEIRNESVISTDKTSEKSHTIVHQGQRVVMRPQVSISNIFKSIAILKNEVKMTIFEEDNKNIIHLKNLNMDRGESIGKVLGHIEEVNSRAPLIIAN